MKWIVLFMPVIIQVVNWLVKAMGDGRVTREEVGEGVRIILNMVLPVLNGVDINKK